MSSPWQWLINKFDSAEQVQQSTYDFMPAALEVQETPPNPVGRAIIWTIVVLFIAAVIWGIVGKMDVVAVAQGKIIPSGRVKTIQPLEIGKVKSIHVKEGQLIKAGDPLITLDGTATQADTDRLYNQLQMTQLQQARQRTFQSLLEQPQIPADWLNTFKNNFIEKQSHITPAITSSVLYSTEQRLLIEQVNQYQSQRKTLESQKNQRQAEQRRIQANITKFKRTLPLISERTNGLKRLLKKKMVAKTLYLELEQERIEQLQDLAASKAQHQELNASLRSLDDQLNTLKAETQTNNLNTLAQTNQTVSQLQQELIKAQQRNQQQVITSPITGSVQQLAIHTVGGVVTPAQELMMIVPEQSQLEVEALILNRDIGFVAEGQIAEVKIDTFNFTKYGLLEGEITNLSNDAISDENLGLVYLTRVLLKETQMMINNKLVNLSPGMSVSVEVKTGQRRIIEYFLSPLLRYKQESIRER